MRHCLWGKCGTDKPRCTFPDHQPRSHYLPMAATVSKMKDKQVQEKAAGEQSALRGIKALGSK